MDSSFPMKTWALSIALWIFPITAAMWQILGRRINRWGWVILGALVSIGLLVIAPHILYDSGAALLLLVLLSAASPALVAITMTICGTVFLVKAKRLHKLSDKLLSTTAFISLGLMALICIHIGGFIIPIRK